MELTVWSSLALISCLHLLILTSPVSAKCHGQWAIHACFGGNGKRSDPNINQGSNIEPSLLHRVLISDAQKLNRMLQAEDDASQEEMIFSPAQNDDDGFKNAADESFQSTLTRNTPEVRDLRRYLRALKIQHALRRKEGDLI